MTGSRQQSLYPHIARSGGLSSEGHGPRHLRPVVAGTPHGRVEGTIGHLADST